MIAVLLPCSTPHRQLVRLLRAIRPFIKYRERLNNAGAGSDAGDLVLEFGNMNFTSHSF